jgi:hypothetical protein
MKKSRWIENVAQLGKVDKGKARKLAKSVRNTIRLDEEIHREIMKILPKEVTFELRQDFIHPYETPNPDTLLLYEVKRGEEEDLCLRVTRDGSILLEKHLWTRGEAARSKS